jgi:c-di-GMP-binding flagellar brake protein YcgR
MQIEQRRNPRFKCSGPAGVQARRAAAPFPAGIADLSVDGCLIVFEGPQRLSQDKIVELTFTIGDQPFRAWGRVRAVRSDTAVGFQFLLLSQRLRRRLESLVEQLIDDSLTCSSLMGAEEQRRYSRIACSAAASVQMAAGEAFVPSSVVNLSAGGCLMAFENPYSLPLGTTVELVFQINQLPFRARGLVKTIRSGTETSGTGTKIGFQFSHLSGNARRLLEGLVEELIRNMVKHLSQSTSAGPAIVVRAPASPSCCATAAAFAPTAIPHKSCRSGPGRSLGNPESYSHRRGNKSRNQLEERP